MLKFESLKKFPFAEKYFLASEGLNIKSFPKYIQRKLFKGISEYDTNFINEIYKWKEEIEKGLDAPFPANKFDLKQQNKRQKIGTYWNIVEFGSLLTIIAFLIIVGCFIWGDLMLSTDYHFLVIPFIIIVICFSIRFFIHIKIIKNIRYIETVFPYASRYLNLNTENEAYYLFSTYLEDIDSLKYFNLDIGYLLRLNTYISVFYSLLKRAISLYPDKILLYYQYGENNSSVIRHKERNLFRRPTELYDYHYINIFQVLFSIEKKNNLEFLLSILSKSKIENIKITPLKSDLTLDFNKNSKYLLAEGSLCHNIGFSARNFFEKKFANYKFSEDSHFKIYAYILFSLLPLCLSFYPLYFRYNYVRDNLAKQEYHILLNDYNEYCKSLYDLEAVNLVVSVRNRLNYNNHVGNSWGSFNSVNGVEINNKTTISYHYGEPIFLCTEIVEYDNWNDVSYNNEYIHCSKEELIEGITISIDSYVFENRGRYSGCHAKWVSTYYIEVAKPDKPIYQNIDISFPQVLSHFIDTF